MMHLYCSTCNLAADWSWLADLHTCPWPQAGTGCVAVSPTLFELHHGHAATPSLEGLSAFECAVHMASIDTPWYRIFAADTAPL